MKKIIKFISGYAYLLLAHGLIPLTWLNYAQQRWIGEQLGLCLLRFDKRSRNIAKVNIHKAFPTLSEAERNQLLRKTFIASGISAMEMLSMIYPRHQHLLERLRSIEGLETIQQTIEAGHSILLLFPHLTSVYFAGYLLHQKTGLSFGIQYNPPRNAVLTRMMHQKIERYASPVFTRTHLNRIVHFLQKPHILWYAPDLDLGRKRSLFIDFFNFPAATSIVTHALVEKTQAKPFTIAFHRDAQGYYDIQLQALTGFGEGTPEHDLRQLNTRIEDIVRPYPEQYLWQYKRYNTRPEGEEKLYHKREATFN